MGTVSKKITLTILSISLLTVMAGAAMAPALGTIREHFSSQPQLLIQFIVSLPALFIIITNLLFPQICKIAKTKTIAMVGLALYVLSGAGAFFIDNIRVILVLRAILGVSVGMIMPLSTGLLSLYFPPEEQGKLMGLAAASNQAGGIVATFLAGFLCSLGWNYAFLVYLLGLIALVLVWMYLPSDKLSSHKSDESEKLPFKKFVHVVIAMFLVMMLFFVYPTNFALTTGAGTSLSTNAITIIMVILDAVAMVVGFFFGEIFHKHPKASLYIAPIGFAVGYFILSLGGNVVLLILGSAILGIANGIGVPLLNTIASIKGGKNAAATIMPFMSAALYLGQFLSPLIISPLSEALLPGDILAPYKIAILFALLYLGHVYYNRHK